MRSFVSTSASWRRGLWPGRPWRPKAVGGEVVRGGWVWVARSADRELPRCKESVRRQPWASVWIGPGKLSPLQPFVSVLLTNHGFEAVRDISAQTVSNVRGRRGLLGGESFERTLLKDTSNQS